MAQGPYTRPEGPEDPDAEAARLEAFRERLRVFAARRLGDWAEAEDVAQETIARAFEALRAGRLRNPAALGSYLFQTALRVCMHRGRSAGRERRALQRFGAAPEETVDRSPLAGLISEQERSSVLDALGTLAPDDRTVLELTYREELGSEEIGRRLGVSAGAVCVRRHRAIRRLAEILGVRKGADRDLDRG